MDDRRVQKKLRSKLNTARKNISSQFVCKKMTVQKQNSVMITSQERERMEINEKKTKVLVFKKDERINSYHKSGKLEIK